MANLSSELAGLSPEELEFLRRRLLRSGRKEGSAAPAPIPRRPAGPSAVSFAQQRLWFLHQLGTGSSAYHIPVALDLSGPVRLDLLAEAFREVGRRHETLRTTFILEGGRPSQLIAPEPAVELPEVDLSILEEGALASELAALAEGFAHRPFDLERGPMLRALAVRTGAGRVRLLLGLHHIAADNWSVGILMREVSEAFNALAGGRRPAWMPLPLQYADYAVWQRGWLQGQVLADQLAFWRRQLEGAPQRIDLPADRPRPEAPSFRYGRFVFRLPVRLTESVRTLGRRHDATLYIVLLAAWSALLHRFGGHEDAVIGSPVANRQRAELEGIIGFFVNTLLMRSQPRPALTFAELLAEVREAALGAYAHQDLPFEKIVEELRPERDTTYQPLFQVMFNVYDGALPELRFAGLEVAGVEVQIGTWNDLDLLLVDTPQGLEGYLRYSRDLFEPATAELLADAYRGVLEQVVRTPEARLAELQLPGDLVARAEAARRRERKALLAVAATFTAEPLAEPLAFWMRQLELPAQIDFAPYHQVFQQLLDPGSLLAGNRHGINLVLVRFEDWCRYQGTEGEEDGLEPAVLDRPEAMAQAERNARDLAAALRQAAARSSIPWILCLCPLSQTAEAPGFAALSARLAEDLARDLQAVPNVYLVRDAELTALYPVDNLHDAFADAAGHVPYSSLGFAALATLLSRKIHALSAPPVKVIALDCDNTLWGGICGEDGPQGVRLDPAYRRLQEFVAAQQREGVLLCLCSKNEEPDVWDVFAQRDDFPLRREHLAAWRVNWRPKSENLRSLAAELDLGLDSFVLIDDNPVEHAEVRANCPGVLILPLPADPERIPHALEHFWAFDRLRVTAEDRRRTELYREAAQRERFRREAAGFQEFLSSLELRVDREELRPAGAAEDLARAAQLTQRTNQFNTTTRRRSEGELRGLLAEDELAGWAVRVRDRFGDYGLVGVVLFAEADDALWVDSLLLSCRVLGRGVEHRLLAALGEEAGRRGLAWLDVEFAPTERNRPALDFLERLGAVREATQDGWVFRLAAAGARAIALAPAGDSEPADASGKAPLEADPEAGSDVGSGARQDQLRRLAELADPREVLRRVEASRRWQRTGPRVVTAPRTPTEERLTAIFAEALGLPVEEVGTRESFFDLGGHSLLGTVVLSRVRDAFGVELSVHRLFEAPAVEELAALIDEEGTDDGRSAPAASEPIVRISTPALDLAARQQSFLASYPQEGLWFLHRLEPESAAYNIPMVLRLAGRPRQDVLERSLQEIVRRHWTLRTSLHEGSEGVVVQTVHAFEAFSLPVLDLTGLQDVGSELRRRISQEVERGFDLARAPLFRAGLLRLAPEEHVVYLIVHHTVFDGWSMGVLVQELVALYRAFAEGQPSPLPELPIQYVDFAGWQRERLEKGSLEPQLAYWRERLKDRPAVLELPADRPRPVRWSFRGAACTVELPAGLVAALAELSRQAGASSFMTLLAGIYALLFRLSGQSDLCVGLPVANRNRSELEGLLGFFANTLVLRSQARGGEGFAGLLGEVKRTALEAYAHQDLPFEKLVEELRPERDLARTPLFQVMLAFQNVPLPPIALPGLTLEALEPERTTARFDLLVEVMEMGSGLRALLEYSTDLFDAPTGVRMSRTFRTLLEEAAAKPRRPLAELPLLSGAERFQLLAEWNDTARTYPDADLLLHQLFEVQARHEPAAEAVRCEGRSLSYGCLDRDSGHLANWLRSHGVGPERIVGVLLDRSFEMVTALLGVLRAGGAYLPLDPSYPVERLAFFVADAAPRLVLTVRSLAGLLPVGIRAVCLDEAWEEIQEATPIPALEIPAQAAAYAIYTSGSTGRPKAAVNAHSGIVNRILWMQEAYGLKPSDRVLQKTPFSFDVSVWEFFWPLSVGACLVMARPGGHRDPTYLAEAIAAEGVTTLHFVPSLLRVFLEAEGLERCVSVRRVMASGEELPQEVAAHFFRRLEGAELHNLYGPTEAAVDVTAWACRPTDARVPIGHPIANVAVHVVDGAGQLMPVRGHGELLLGGVGVGRGYLGRPELTAERFVPDPFSGNPGSRLYRTGDLACRRPDGSVDFLGRTDLQVKIRGFRIELREIEAALRRFPGVADVAVLAREYSGGDRRLVAYVTPPSLDLEALRTALRQSLPGYMVPASFVLLEALPLSPNGKLDRKALPEPGELRSGVYVAPRTAAEERIAGIWAQVLGAERLSVEDNPFDLGAHSLLATQVLSRLNRDFELDLPLRALFELPTSALLAAEVERMRAGGTRTEVPPIRPVLRGVGPLPLSFAQRRIWFLERWEPGSAVFNMSTAVHFTGLLRLPALAATVAEVVRRHEVLRTRFEDVDGEPVQVVDPPGPLAVPVVDLAGLPKADQIRKEAERLAVEEAVRPFDLRRGPLLRSALVRRGPEEHEALLTLHHIAADGWSLGLLVREIGAVYSAVAAGRPPTLPELPIQYADFAAWQRGWLQGEVLSRELEHWRSQLAGAPESLDLPLDRPRGAVQRFRGGHRPFALTAETVAGLRALGRGAEATLFMVLLAAFKALLLRYTHQPDLVVGTLIANRNRSEVEGLIGCFANTLVLRDRMPGEATFREALARLRARTLDAYAHQDFPFEKLVEELNPERQLSLTPLFQVMFVLQNTPAAALELPGLELDARELERGTVNYDLFFILDERGGGITGHLDFDVDLFDGTTVERLLRHFEAVLAAVAADPDLGLADLPLLGEAERHQALVEWNDSDWRRPDAAAGVLAGIAAQAERRPQATAVVYGAERLTYGELAARVERGAEALAARGVGRGALVALLADRGPDLLAAILAAFRCGAAYLPLDPHHPPRRLAQVVGRSGSCLVLASAPLAPLAGAALEAFPAAGRSALGELAELFAARPDPAVPPALPAATAPEDLAYVIYTSGSTGVPKGVMVEHRGMLNHLWAKIEALGLTAVDRVAQNASQCFDISVWQLLAGLLVGGEVHILPDEVAHDPWSLLRETESAGITVLETVPSLLRLMVEEAEGQGEARPALARLRWMIPTGEALPESLCRRWLALYPAIPLLNAYGPTECSDDVSHGAWASAVGPVAPIGRPVLNTRLHLLDPWLRPVPVGVAGELCVGGVGVGRGYLGDGARTGRSFVPDPFAAAPGGRLYRTGDLARFLADGRIEFLGRLDHQVKVRGFRIELGEIEAVLREHPAVREAVVVARREEGAGSDLRLVGYVEPDPDYRGHPAGLEGSGSSSGASAAGAGSLQTEQVSQWAAVFDDFYAAEALPEDPTFNTAAWVSSYTGGRIPEPEMREWLADTVERIAGLGATRLLELGCGTGMLLFRLAPGCSRYLGTDIAAEGLTYLRRQLDERGGLPQVELLERSADDFSGVAPDSFDGVVVNSVVQYFPSIDYLARVLEGAVASVAPGGFIFLGDLRSLPLLEAFHTSVELAQADPSLSTAALRQRVQSRLRQETELVVDPDFFLALRHHLPKIGRVEIHPKRGRAHNELTCFRYQVVLRVGVPPAVPVVWADWQAEGWSLETLRQALAGAGTDAFHLANIANARMALAAAATHRLAEVEELATVADLRRAVAEECTWTGAVDPQDLWDLAAAAGWEADLGWSHPGPQGRFEAVLRRRGAGGRLTVAPVLSEAPPLQRLSRYANQPLQGKFASQVAPRLSAFLADRLPEYMVPSAWVALDSLPLTPNGKIDYRALPAPEARANGDAFLPPRTPTEQRLAEIWSEVLGVRSVGARDDFFAIGGHSLLATQVSSRVRVVFDVDLPLRDLFEARTLEALAGRIEIAAKTVYDLRVIPIQQAPRDEPPILSFSQERLWFLDQLEPGNFVYNLPSVLRCKGEVQRLVLDRTCTEVVRRHETLRTTFPAIDGRVLPVVHPPAPQTVPLVDLCDLSEDRRDTEARRLVREEGHRPFDLAQGPLLRVLLLRLQPDEHLLLSTLHHIASDAWSMWVFVQEVAAIYNAYWHGLASPLPEPRIQYRDFARWQRQTLDGERLQKLIAHWRERLGDAREVLALPTDRPRPAVQTTRGGMKRASFSTALSSAIQALGHRESATMFMVLLTGFNALLYRYTGQEDLSVGTLIANRDRVEIEKLIGCFINTLVLRNRPSGRSRFLGELARVREVTLDAYANPDLPFERLVEELRPERDLSHPPLCQVLFVFQNVPKQALELPGVFLQMVEPDHAASPLDMTWTFDELGGQLFGTVEYNLDLLDGATVQRMIGAYAALLQAAAESPGLPLSDLPLLEQAQRRQLLTEWNDTAVPYRREICLHELVAAQAERTPDAVAVAFEKETLTYAELVRRARRLASLLNRQGVGLEARVGVLAERSLEMIIALLGTLEAGAAYVPLDPALPAQRLSLFVESAGISTILTQERHSALVSAPSRFLLDSGWSAVEAAPYAPPSVRASEGNLAYVIYTSGSTGAPKGVMISHRGIVNRLLWMQEAYGLRPEERVLQKTPFGFDVSLWELFWPLLTGARLVFARPEGHKDPQYLAGLIEQEGITTLHFVPSMLQAFVDADWSLPLASLERVVTSGEALPPELVRRFFARLGHSELHNLYGPTEASVDVSFWSCVPGSPTSIVPIGRPIANHCLYVGDRYFDVQPIGVPGELLLGGPGLARGYLGRPDLTAAAFIPDPFGASPGERLYRSGDLVRWLPDGNLQFLGRIDHQVKIRGFRIELGEIERTLDSHPQIAESVVLAWEGGAAPRLIAYAAVAPGAVDSEGLPEALRAHLQGRLPEYMIPSTIVVLDSLPRTSNGKIDRRALPAPGESRPELRTPFRAPVTAVERELAKIWSEVLRIDQVGADDPFLELGGDSILGLQVVSRASRAGCRFLLKDLFEQGTVSRLAVVARVVLPENREAMLPPAPAAESFPLTPMQQGILFHTLYAPDSDDYLVETVLGVGGPLDLAVLEEAWRRLVARHPALRSVFRWEGLDRPLQAVLPAEDIGASVHLQDLSGFAPDAWEVRFERWLEGERRERRPDLGSGPLAWLAAFRFAEGSHRLVLGYHHLILDGWSTALIVRELAALYAAGLEGRTLELPEPLPYQEYVAWLEAQSLAPAQAYWRERLAGFTASTALGCDQAPGRPAVTEGESAERRLDLSSDETVALERVARGERLTLNTLVQGCWATLLGVHSGSADVVFGVTTAGRPPELPGAESLVGLCINTLPLRAQLDTGSPAAHWLRRLQKGQAEAQAYEHAPLAQVQKWSEVPAGSPLFEVLYVFGNFVAAAGGPDTASVAFPLLRTVDRTHYPLSLEVEPGARLGLRIVHDRTRFADVDATRLLEGLRRLLAAVAADPCRPLADLPYLSAAERQQVLIEWSDTAAPSAMAARIVDLIAGQAQRTPAALAAVCGEESLTYRELLARVDGLASHLSGLGAGPERVVALLCHRGLDLLTAILASFQAGAAYLPLDPHHPPERTAQILDRSGAPLVLASRELLPTLAPLAPISRPADGRQLACLEDLLGREPAGGPTPAGGAGGSHLAYVIYTSGSTGVPKGAMVEHRGMLNHLYAKIEDLGLRGCDRVAQTASQCFDISVWQFLAALVVGGTVHIFPDEVVQDPARLLAEADRHGVTVLETVPSLLRLMLDEAEAAGSGPALAALRWMIPTGEALPPESCRRWLALYPGVPLLNAYGPTECSDDVTHRTIHEPPPAEAAQVPIGRAVRNTRLHVLDREMRPLPMLVAGELYVGGDGVGRGYLAEPARTALAFVPDPTGLAPGARLYRTGDRARHLPDGNLDFLGRVDHQVKIRGFRIELGEIEAALAHVPGVRQAVVVDAEAAPGDRRLAAYIVASGRPVPSPETLRESLRERLPDYMVPAAFVFLEALPLTRNGKVDRRALPSPAVAGRSAAPAAPRSEVERQIAAVWGEVLGLQEVGVEDNFFDLGGHSLLLVQVLSRLRKAFDAELAMVDLFRHPTVSGLAAHVARQREAGDGLEERYTRADLRRQASGRRRQFVQGRRGQRDKELVDDAR